MKPKYPLSQVQLFNKAKSLMLNAQRRITRGDLYYTGQDYQADTKHDKAWRDYGWPNQLSFFMLWNMWRRNSVASAVVKLPVKMCWMTKPDIKESKEPHEETQFEKEFDALCKKLKLWKKVKGADLRQRVGRYGAIIWTVADGQEPNKPLLRVSKEKVINATPVFEGQLEPTNWDRNFNSPRYGLPIMYTLNEADTGGRSIGKTQSRQIHWTRVTIFAEGADDGTIEGIPCLESIFNDLIDWDKLKGSGGEGFWRAAAQKFILQAAKESAGSNPSKDDLKIIKEALVDMFSGFDKMPYTGGWELKSLDTSMPNPEHFVATVEKAIAAGSEIPLKILFGSQTGVKAGDEDTGHFMRVLQSRRENELADMIEGVVDWLLVHTDLTKPVEYEVVWDDLTAPTAEKRAEIAKTLSSINKELASVGQDAPFKSNEIREAAGYDADDELDDSLDMSEHEEVEAA